MTRRAVLLSLALVTGLCLLTPYVEFVIQGAQIGAFSPPGGAFLSFLFLSLVMNPLIRRLGGRPLSGRELSVIYCALLAMAVIPSCQFSGWIFTVVTGPFYYATPANQWAKYWGYIPEWWGPRFGPEVKWFYEGLPPGVRSPPLMPWLLTFLTWGPFIFAFYFAGLCLTVILRRQWVEHERLSFPLARLPLELAERGESLLKEKLLWAGAAIPILFHLISGLGRIYPFLPKLRLELIPIDQMFTGRPWIAIRPLTLSVYFSLIGFAYLGGVDVPLSMWLFFLLFKLECVFGCAMGWTMGETRALMSDEFPLVVGQQAGSILALVSTMLWAARGHIKAVLRKALTGSGADDSDEPASYRAAVFGFLLSFCFLCFWAWASGMRWWAAPILFALTFSFMLGVHRMMAEGGVNFLWAAQSGPNFLFYSIDGGRWLGVRSWVVLLFLPYFIWNFKGPVGPQTFEGFKLTTETGASERGLLKLLLGSILLAIFVSFWWTLYLVYTQGGGVNLDAYRFVHVGHRPMQELVAVTSNPVGPSRAKIAAILASAAFTFFLAAMRWRFPWWRLHPLGYAASTIWAMHFMWFSLMVGSLANILITRYGGFRAYQRARPFFLGLILGEFIMVGFFMALRAAVGARGAEWERTAGGLF